MLTFPMTRPRSAGATTVIKVVINSGIITAVPLAWITRAASSTAKLVIPELMREGRVARGWLGIGGQSQGLSRALVRRLHLTVESGVLVVAVAGGGPGEAAGLAEGDVILKLDGEPTPSVDDVHKLLVRERIGKIVELLVLRNGNCVKLSLTVSPRPEPRGQ